MTSPLTVADVSAIRVETAPRGCADVSLIGNAGELVGVFRISRKIWQRLCTHGEEATYHAGCGPMGVTFELGQENEGRE